MRESTSLLITFLLLFSFTLTAQRQIQGTITNGFGEPLAGATILEKGVPENGSISDLSGNYQLTISEGATLVFTYIGFEEQEIIVGSRTILDIIMQEGVELSEVIITALGIAREKKSLGYSAQEVKGETLNFARETNIVTSLAGRVVGVQVVSSSQANPGGSAHVRIRGSNGLLGGAPLFVVDGTPISNETFPKRDLFYDLGNLSQDINPDDIEAITVLKGPSATALYGQRAANGVIMVTTKKGKNQEGIGVTFNSSITMDKVAVLPSFQNEYAGGYNGEFAEFVDPLDGKTYKGLEYYADESWGPKIDGTTMYRPWWSWYPGEDYGKEIPLIAQPNNVKDFYNTGITYNNHIALAGGRDNYTFRLSYTNVNQSGVMPNTFNRKNNLSLNASLDLTAKLSVSANLNLISNSGKKPKIGGSENNPASSLNQWFQRQLDIERIKEYKNPDGSARFWNISAPDNLQPVFWGNPFFNLYEDYSTDSRNRFFGNVKTIYSISDQWSIEGVLRRDKYIQRREGRLATGGSANDGYSEFIGDGQEENYELLLKYQQNFGILSLNAQAGGNLRRNGFHSTSASTSGGLTSPNLFNLSASVDRPRVENFISNKKVRSVYGAINAGFKNFLYLGSTFRNDWSSALPIKNNSYLYPSVNASLVFSELIEQKWLSYGKLRASFAQVGADTDPFQIIETFQSSFFPYGDLPTFFVQPTLFNENLKPALSSSYEFGLELNLFDNRFGLDLTYYRENNKDQIIKLNVSETTGYNNAIINAGNIRDEGFELSLFGNPIRSKKFRWDWLFNLAKNESKILALARGLNNQVLAGFSGFRTVNAPVGGEWGLIRGTAFKRVNGIPIITEDGRFVAERDQDLGGILPDFTGGLMNKIQFLGIEITALLDFQIGGQFVSSTKNTSRFAGIAKETTGFNDKGNNIRDPVDQGGGIKIEGVLENGMPHIVYVDPQTHFQQFRIDESAIYSSNYFKLREIKIGYNFPKKWLTSSPFSKLNFSLIGRNLWLIHSAIEGVDPSEISTRTGTIEFTRTPLLFQEVSALPGIRSFGLNLNVGF